MHVQSATASERITFAFVSPADLSSLTSSDGHPAGLQPCRHIARHCDDSFAAGPIHLAVSESRQIAEHRRLTPDEAAALLNVPKSDVAAPFQGRLATCSVDQLLRMLTWLGNDVEILIASKKQAARILTVSYILGKIDA